MSRIQNWRLSDLSFELVIEGSGHSKQTCDPEPGSLREAPSKQISEANRGGGDGVRVVALEVASRSMGREFSLRIGVWGAAVQPVCGAEVTRQREPPREEISNLLLPLGMRFQTVNWKVPSLYITGLGIMSGR